MDVGCRLRGFGGPTNRQNNKKTNQKRILASKKKHEKTYLWRKKMIFQNLSWWIFIQHTISTALYVLWRKCFWIFFLREFSSAAPTLARRWSMHKPSISALNELAVGDFPRKTPWCADQWPCRIWSILPPINPRLTFCHRNRRLSKLSRFLMSSRLQPTAYLRWVYLSLWCPATSNSLPMRQ